jgi:HSP20 family protein
MLPTLWNRTRTSPFDALMDMHREMDRLLGGFDRPNGGELASWTTPTEVRETADALLFSIELPGMRSEDIELTVENNVLTVSGEKKFEREAAADEGEYRLFERRYGRFSRSFSLPPTVDANKVDANYDSGVLTVRLPKSETARPRRIQIGGTAARQVEGKKK